jgi:hypothetical protein
MVFRKDGRCAGRTQKAAEIVDATLNEMRSWVNSHSYDWTYDNTACFWANGGRLIGALWSVG